MEILRSIEGTGARCLEFVILTACRSGEARLASWQEIDIDGKTWNIPGERIKPYVLAYLLVLGVVVLVRAFGKLPQREVRHAGVLGFIGGLLDAVGGGGWGPITTSTLLARGRDPRTAIGSVNAAEFVVTVAISTMFLTQVGISHVGVVGGLLVGGACAAPLSAWLVRYLPARTVMASVAIVVLGLSGWQLAQVLAR